MTKVTREQWARILGLAGVLLALFLLSTLASCSSLWPLGGSMAGAAAGSLGGPGGAALGAGAGYGAGEILKATAGDDPAQVIASKVEGMTAGDIQALIKATAGENKGVMETLASEIYALLKMLGILTALAFIAHFAWTWKRKKKGEAFYAELEQLKNKLK
jgi:hypothetical protein